MLAKLVTRELCERVIEIKNHVTEICVPVWPFESAALGIDYQSAAVIEDPQFTKTVFRYTGRNELGTLIYNEV